MSRFHKFVDETCGDHKKRKRKRKGKMDEGVGYELYAKGADRLATQSKQIAIYAEKLADAARKNKSLNIKKKALKELDKWMKSMQKDINKGVIMRLVEHLDEMNEATSNIRDVADDMTRLIMGDKDMALKNLKKSLPLNQATFDAGKEYNKAFTDLRSDIAAAIKIALKAAK
jgi:hypothetical protein